MTFRGACLIVGFLCLAVGTFSCIQSLSDRFRQPEVPPVVFIGLLWLMLGFLLSRKGAVRRIIAFVVGTLAVFLLLAVMPRALYSPRPWPMAIYVGVWIVSAGISGSLAVYAPEPRKSANEVATPDQK